MKHRKILFRTRNPFDCDKTNQLFLNAMKENCSFQYYNSPEYKMILDNMKFHPNRLEDYSDIAKIPFLPTLFFKNHSIFSVPQREILLKATSSGTKGKISTIAFEAGGLLCGLNMVLRIGHWRKLFSIIPANYIVLGYKPHKENTTAVTKTAFGATMFAPAIKRIYALKYKKGSYEADLEGVIKAIQKYSSALFPMRFMGFPSYLYFVLKIMEERSIFLKLPKGSKIMLGGGWKQFYTEQVEKQVLYDLVYRVLNIQERDIVEFFGAVEHPILYCDCPNHHFHVPVYSRVIIRDVNTLQSVPCGQIGLVNLLTPMVKATPILSIMTDDLGILHDGKECGCGLTSPFLEIIGRVGLNDIKTCAAGAAEKLS